MPIDAQRCLGFNDVPMSRVLGLVVAASRRRREPLLRQAARLRRAHLRPHAGRRRRLHHHRAALAGDALGQPQAGVRQGLLRGPEPAGLARVRLLARRGGAARASSTSPARTSTRTSPGGRKSGPFFGYINRCQFMLQQGLFVADVCYYYGDHVPNFAQLKRSDPARVLPGYDYDVITEEVAADPRGRPRRPHRAARRHELSRAGAAGRHRPSRCPCCAR